MEQRINENFNEKLNEGIGRIEKIMLEMNQNRRRVSPESNHGGVEFHHIPIERGVSTVIIEVWVEILIEMLMIGMRMVENGGM